MYFSNARRKRFPLAQFVGITACTKFQVFFFFYFIRTRSIDRRRAVVYTAGREQQTRRGRARKNKNTAAAVSNSISYALTATANVYTPLSNCIHFVRRRRVYNIILHTYPIWALAHGSPATATAVVCAKIARENAHRNAYRSAAIVL